MALADTGELRSVNAPARGGVAHPTRFERVASTFGGDVRLLGLVRSGAITSKTRLAKCRSRQQILIGQEDACSCSPFPFPWRIRRSRSLCKLTKRNADSAKARERITSSGTRELRIDLRIYPSSKRSYVIHYRFRRPLRVHQVAWLLDIASLRHEAGFSSARSRVAKIRLNSSNSIIKP